jgi:hypothetical protein
MVDPKNQRWQKPSSGPIFNSSPEELALWNKVLDEQSDYLLVLADVIYTASEPVAAQLIPLYNRIATAKKVADIVDLTTHDRFAVRTAALNKMSLLQGESIYKVEKIPMGYARWPVIRWQAPRRYE